VGQEDERQHPFLHPAKIMTTVGRKLNELRNDKQLINGVCNSVAGPDRQDPYGMFMGLLDPELLLRGTAPYPAPDPSISCKNSKKNLDSTVL
jgi:hypothetical protein